ncbi:MAG: pyridoxamine 5'-phosphate oxidase family protein [Oscillospiraceae bacterium]|nr:pyridoxamine 5'-phosphate oxidase family protein [Oscillospiraceae bacterium]
MSDAKRHEEIIARTSALINSKKDYIGDGMAGYAVLSLIDDQGYPTSATMTISKADGIRWLTFLTDTDGVKAKRIARCNKACVCLSSSEYHISLTGTVEIITDLAVKKENWQDTLTKYYGAEHTDPDWAVLRFTAETYNLYFADNDSEAKGSL